MKTYDPKLTKIRLAQTLEFQAFYPEKKPIDREDIREFDFRFEVIDALLFEEKLMRLELLIDILVLLPKKRKYKKAGMIRTEFIFHVEDFQDWVQERGDTYFVESYLAATLAGLAYSTTRGLLMARTSGTFLEGCLLPVIDPTSLLEVDP